MASEPVRWRETHMFSDPGFEPRDVEAVYELGTWRIAVKGIWDSCWSEFETPPPELIARAEELTGQNLFSGVPAAGC